MICYIDTPKSILDDGNDYYDADTDIFEEIFDTADNTFTNSAAMQTAMWRTFRIRMISNFDTEEWVQAMADRLDMIGPKYDAFITYATQLGSDLLDLSEAAYERILQRTAIDDTAGDVRTVSHTGSDSHVTVHESLPQTLTGSTVYADARQTDTTTPGVTDTDTYVPNNQDTETYKGYSGLNGDTFTRMMQAYPNVFRAFCDEFQDMFLVML